ncbi:coiled-coil-helix-coiled-coil-helix domain containing 3 [Haemaphysalis longicornis]
MGSSGSTRRVTIVNENSPDVIKISDSVVKRLKGESESVSASVARQTTASAPYDSRAGGDALQGRRLHHDELKKVDDVWRERLKEVERQNQELYKLATDKFAGAVKAVEDKYTQHKCIPVCEAQQQKVMECYAKNQHAALNCSKLVDAFTKCVHQARKEIIAQ